MAAGRIVPVPMPDRLTVTFRIITIVSLGYSTKLPARTGDNPNMDEILKKFAAVIAAGVRQYDKGGAYTGTRAINDREYDSHFAQLKKDFEAFDKAEIVRKEREREALEQADAAERAARQKQAQDENEAIDREIQAEIKEREQHRREFIKGIDEQQRAEIKGRQDLFSRFKEAVAGMSAGIGNNFMPGFQSLAGGIASRLHEAAAKHKKDSLIAQFDKANGGGGGAGGGDNQISALGQVAGMAAKPLGMLVGAGAAAVGAVGQLKDAFLKRASRVGEILTGDPASQSVQHAPGDHGRHSGGEVSRAGIGATGVGEYRHMDRDSGRCSADQEVPHWEPRRAVRMAEGKTSAI